MSETMSVSSLRTLEDRHDKWLKTLSDQRWVLLQASRYFFQSNLFQNLKHVLSKLNLPSNSNRFHAGLKEPALLKGVGAPPQ